MPGNPAFVNQDYSTTHILDESSAPIREPALPGTQLTWRVWTGKFLSMKSVCARLTYFELERELEQLSSSYGFSAAKFKENIGDFPTETIERALKIMKDQLECVEEILKSDSVNESNLVFIADFQFRNRCSAMPNQESRI